MLHSSIYRLLSSRLDGMPSPAKSRITTSGPPAAQLLICRPALTSTTHLSQFFQATGEAQSDVQLFEAARIDAATQRGSRIMCIKCASGHSSRVSREQLTWLGVFSRTTVAEGLISAILAKINVEMLRSRPRTPLSPRSLVRPTGLPVIRSSFHCSTMERMYWLNNSVSETLAAIAGDCESSR